MTYIPDWTELATPFDERKKSKKELREENVDDEVDRMLLEE